MGATRKREINRRRRDFAHFNEYVAECCQAIQDTTISVTHITELPEDFEIAYQEGYPKIPPDGLLAISCVIPSANRSVRTDRERDR